MSEDSHARASRLNRDCHCVTLDRRRLANALGVQGDALGLASLLQSHPHLFADAGVYVAPEDLAQMAAIVRAVEDVVALPAWQQQAFARHAPLADGHAAGTTAGRGKAARGVFFGYDFHLDGGTPQLIEINTNAGGGLLNVALRAAQVACCDEARGQPLDCVDGAGLVAMFRAEWQRARGEQAPPLRRIAIVDDEPETQYLHPEFVLFQRLFAAHGIEAQILDAKSLRVDGDVLQSQAGWPIDLVYNRVTDFLLTDPAHAALSTAWRNDLAVVTPHPHAWALYADKRNLVTLTNTESLRALGADAGSVGILQSGIPQTLLLTPENAAELWAERRRWFFKPAAGFGSKAAYRGDKLTRGKWQEILDTPEPFVAQRVVPPGERRLQLHDSTTALKVDLRNYVYAGRVQLVTARLYQGQTTNFRTEGGGFAAVFAV
jgi:hypothetical protein